MVRRPPKKALMTYEPAFRILLFVFVLFLLLAFSVGLKHFLDNLLEFKIDPISQSSALALACAINSEAVGHVGDYTCENDGITRNAGSVSIQPIYTFDDAIDAIEANNNNPTAMILRDMNRIRMRVENFITGLFGIKLAYAERNPVGYSFDNSVVVCADKKLLDDKKLWKDPAEMKKEINKYFSNLYTDDFKCEVFNFYLRQKKRDILSLNGRAAPAFIDPDVIVYYNSFPEGEARAWLNSEKAADMVGMVVLSGVINMAFGVGGKLLGPIREMMEGNLKSILEAVTGTLKGVLMKNAEESVAEVTSEAVLSNFVKNGDTYLAIAIENDLKENGIENVNSEEIKKLLDESLKNENGGNFEDFLSRLKEKVPLSEKNEEMLRNEYSMVYDVLKAARNGEIKKRFIIAILNTDTKIAKAVMKNMDDDAIKKLAEKESEEDAMKYVLDYFKDHPDKAQKLAKDIRSELKYYRLAYILKNSPDAKAKARAFGEAFFEVCKNNRHFHFFMLQALDEAGVIDKIFPTNDPNLMFLKRWGIDAFECNRLRGGSVGACALAALFYAMNQVDASVNYKNMVAKTNSLLVYSPRKVFLYMFELEANPKHAIETIPLVKEASTYIVMLNREGNIGGVKLGSNTLLYLASPCKVDLLVEKSTGGETCKVPVFDSQKCMEYVNKHYNCKGIESYDYVKPGDRSTEIEFYKEAISHFSNNPTPLDYLDDNTLLNKLKTYVKNHIKTQTVAESIDPNNATLKHREFCIAMKNVCELLPNNPRSICDDRVYLTGNVRSRGIYKEDDKALKNKTCAYAAEVVGAGGLIFHNGVLYPTYPAVMCVDRCDTKNPVWGLFREGHMAAMQYYDSSSFKWYMDGSVSRLRVEDTLPLHAECETSSIIDKLFTWLNMGPPEVHPPTIYVRPVASYKDVNQNFCFWGDNSGINVVTKAVVTAVISAAEVATMAIVDFGTGGAGIAVNGLIHFGFGALQGLASAGIDATYEWPNNPAITGLPLAP